MTSPRPSSRSNDNIDYNYKNNIDENDNENEIKLIKYNNIKIRWKLDTERIVLLASFGEREGWARTEFDDWNIYWASVSTIRQIFNPENGYRLRDDQLVNHFPNHFELTRKDLMVKNIKRYRKEMQKIINSVSLLSSGSINTLNKDSISLYNSEYELNEYNSAEEFIPSTYLLPADYSLFVEEYRRNPNLMWIMKPTGKSQGKGIFIINKLSQIKRWSQNRWANIPIRESYVISRYIEKPLLIGGKKFDLRLYVLVTSYRPLMVYEYIHGFARFSNVQYSNSLNEIDNPFIHLTNVSIQKHSDDYNRNHGGKWHIRNLRLYLESIYGYEATDLCFREMDNVIINSLKAVQNIIVNDRHCFECYGYDIIIDDDLKPWLVEVNASPSLSTTTESDRIMKTCLLRDILRIVAPLNNDINDTGDFIILYNEIREKAKIAEASGKSKDKISKKNRSISREWR